MILITYIAGVYWERFQFLCSQWDVLLYFIFLYQSLIDLIIGDKFAFSFAPLCSIGHFQFSFTHLDPRLGFPFRSIVTISGAVLVRLTRQGFYAFL